MADDLAGALWRKSTRSGTSGTDCVEVATTPSVIGVRDTKDRQGPHLAVTPADWVTFTARIKAGALAA